MSNLTVSVDDDLIKRARIRAIQQGTSLSAKVREFLLQYASQADDELQRQRDDATARLMAAIEAATLQQPPVGAAAAPAAQPQRSLRDGLYADGFRAVARQAEPGSTAP